MVEDAELCVAVIGMACRFPGARDVEQFWKNLREGVESISFFSREELEAAGVDPALLGNPRYVKAHGVVEDAEMFDAAFFGFGPREAEITDPQHRVFLECAWEALEHAGYDPRGYKDGRIGVFGGCSTNRYLLNVLGSPELVDAVDEYGAVIACSKDFLTTRVSYKLNLEGPSVTVQTACSTSLVAVYLACQSLLSFGCDVALSGGVHISVPQKDGYLHQEGGILSSDGHCRAFDASSDGIVPGSGVGIVVLKRLNDALRDGDTVYAVIRGSAVNNDGSQKVGYTAPSIDGQTKVVVEALSAAGVTADTLSYVEAHGTGTALGDPVEIAALTNAFGGSDQDRGRCAIGSVKTNIGHLDAAAGIASLIKTILALRNKEIPPSLHFDTPNPRLSLEKSPFYVNRSLTPWSSDGSPRRAGVSSLGIGGTNAHVILEEAPEVAPSGSTSREHLLVLSARTASALEAATKRLTDHLATNPGQSLADVAYTLQAGRHPFEHRRAVACVDIADAVAALQDRDRRRIMTDVAPGGAPEVVFMFSGQGAQYVDMARDLYDNDVSFREDVDECAERLVRSLGVDLRRFVYPARNASEEAARRLSETDLVQPALFAIEYALARRWMRWGVAPTAMIGHSVGEYVAACLAGVLSLGDALDLVAARGKLMQRLPEGAMTAVPLAAGEVEPLLDPSLSIASINTPSQCVVSGPLDAILGLESHLALRGATCRRVRAARAFHSRMVEPAMAEFASRVSAVKLRAPQIPIVSNVTGRTLSEAEATDPAYWARHMRAPVLFADGIGALLTRASSPILLEVGPGSTLAKWAKRCAEGAAVVACASMPHPREREGRSDSAAWLSAAGRIWTAGVSLDWHAVHRDERRRRVPLPTYPFERQRYWVAPPSRQRLFQSARSSDMAASAASPAERVYLPSWRRTAPVGLLGRNDAADEKQRWLVLADEHGLGARIASRLEVEGHSVVTVTAGSALERRGERTFAIDPARLDDYRGVIDDLRRQWGTPPQHIVHLWGVSAREPAEVGDAFARYQELGLLSLILLAQALGSGAPPVHLGVVTSDMQAVLGDDLLSSEKATALGACRVIPMEHSDIRCISIDIQSKDVESRGISLAADIISDIRVVASDVVLSYRGGHRWAQHWEPATLPRAEAPGRLRDGGVYLVTGGLDGILGYTLAEHLARSVKARLILVGHHARRLSDETARVAALKALGAEVVVERIDLSNHDVVRRLVDDIHARFGMVHGVIHAASGEGGGSIQEHGASLLETSVMRSRVGGARALKAAFAHRTLDFMVICSSLPSLTGQSARLDACAASTFLDALAQQSGGGPGPCTISIGWPPGAFDGAAEPSSALSAAEIIDVFTRVLSSSPPYVAVSRTDPARLLERGFAPGSAQAGSPRASHERPELAARYVAPRNDTEQKIASVLGNVLGIEHVGVDDSFFELGGDSLMATRAAALLRDALGIELPSGWLIELPTVGSLAARVEAARLQGLGLEAPAIVRLPDGAERVTSFGQERLWFLDQLDPGSALYNVPAAVELRGPLNAEALEASLREVVRRHEALRTRFGEEDGRPRIIVEPEAALIIDRIDLRALPPLARQEAVKSAAIAEAQRPFDLTRTPLLRATLLIVAPDEHFLLFTMHHIVSDGWSLSVLLREVAALYGALADGQPSPLPELPLQYADYARWQRSWLTGPVLERDIAYFKQALAGSPAALDLPTDRPRPREQSSRGGRRSFVLGEQLTRALKEIGASEGATLFMTLLAAFKTLLSRYSGQRDIVVGTPIANRTRVEIEGLIGFFVNTLVLRTQLSPDDTFRSLVRRVRDVALGAYAHQHLPFEQLVDALGVERDLSRTPLFQVMFGLNDARIESVQLPGLSMDLHDFHSGTAKFDLTLDLLERGGRLVGYLEYRTDLFDDATAARMVAQLETLLNGIVADPDGALWRLPLLPDQELHKLLVDWNDTAGDFPRGVGIHQLFEAQAARTPDATALLSDGRAFSYQELNRRANQLARYLRACGVTREARVGLCVDRSIDMVVGLLGILKAGGAYVPLDPTYPRDRLAFMVSDSKSALLLTQASLVERVPVQPDVRIERIDADWEQISKLDASDLSETVAPEQLAYVIYTSGSTGKPKGVQVHHRGVVNFLEAMRHAPGLTSSDVLAAVTSLSFDIAGLEIYLPLTVGATICLVRREVASDGDALWRELIQAGATVIQATPTTYRMLLDAGWRMPGSLKVLCGGEALPPVLAEDLARAAKEVWNLYGPTETTIWSTSHRVGAGALTIGRPILNTDVYLLDEHLQVVPTGVPGDLYIGGEGVARGYYGRPDLTAQSFVPNPFTGDGARMYRTGDRARYLADGTIEFLGRSDYQLKIRGFRIELGEIELALARHPQVHQAIVIAREDNPGDKRLVAYLVLTPTSTEASTHGASPRVTADDMRSFSSESLPDYMVPSFFVVLDAMPLTPNGKVDRRALPAPLTALDPGRAFVAPKSAVETALASIWSSVLQKDPIGVHDDFFALGGHSLLATQIVARVRQVFKVEIPLRALFESLTVARLAARLEAAIRRDVDPEEEPRIERGVSGAELVTSFGQERLWFLDQIEPGSPLYNIPAAVELRGPLNAEAIEASLREVVRRHEVLRTRFEEEDGRPRLVVDPDVEIRIQRVDLRDLQPSARQAAVQEAAVAEARRPFDLSRAPLLRATMLSLEPELHILLFTMHHIASDGWSLGVLMNEVTALYGALVNGQPSPLPALPLQYADYARWQRKHLTGSLLERELAYWKATLAGIPAALELPTDRQRPKEQTFRGERCAFVLERSLIAKLKELGGSEGATLFIALLAGFQALLSRYAGQRDVAVGTPIANRTHAELEGLIGFFVNTLVLRMQLSPDDTFRGLVRRVRDVAFGAYAHQHLPFEQLVDALEVERDLGRTPLFQVMFGMNEPVLASQSAGLTLNPIGLETGTSKYDLELLLVEVDGEVQGSIEYNADLFDAGTIARMARHYRALLESAVADPAVLVERLTLLSPAELTELLVEPNRTDVAWPRDVCMHELFERQVECAPDGIAATCNGEELTYAALNARANQLAYVLRARGVRPEALVALVLDRSNDFLASMLGVFKAGGAYVPLDPALPRPRLVQILAQARPVLILTEPKHLGLAHELASGAVEVVSVSDALASGAPGDNLRHDTTPSNLAYVIFTSGSTGTPKGAMLEHAGMLNHLRAKVDSLGVTPADVVAQIATQSFDVHVWQFLTGLLGGGRVAIFNDGAAWEPAKLLAQVERDRVTILETVPTHLRVIIDEIESNPTGYDISSLRVLMLNGEPLQSELCARWSRIQPGIPIINAYGPTECSDDVTQFTVNGTLNASHRYVPITGTLPNLKLYILDEALYPVPRGVIGELCVGGIGVGRGYIGEPAKSAAVFVPDPYTTEPGARMYRTGDRVRYTNDGHLEILGRVDHQIKIRGSRIEISEIEAHLVQHPGVRECTVVAVGESQGDKRLIAYVAGDTEALSTKQLSEHLHQRLPVYMVPSGFVILSELPLLPNGKIDRARLLRYEPNVETADAGYIAPRTPVEATVAEIWRELLELARVGATDNFFQLGGHSLIAVQITSRIRRLFGVELPVRVLFEEPTVAQIAARVDGQRHDPTAERSGADARSLDAASAGAASGAPPAPLRRSLGRHPEQDAYALAPPQLPVWYTHELAPDSPLYNICFANMLFTGEMDLLAFAKTWQVLIDRHPVFRTHFATIDGRPVQRVRKELKIELGDIYLDRRGVALESMHDEIQRIASEYANVILDFEQGPMFRVKLAEFPGKQFLLVFMVHHVLWDETSTINLARELTEIYNAIRAGRDPELPSLEVDYVDYALWINEMLAASELQAERQYWLSQFTPPPPPLDLPTDFPRPKLQTFNGSEVSTLMPAPLRAKLEAYLKSNESTLYIFLLSILTVQLYRLSGQEDIVIGSPLANRDDERLEGMLGLFATALPMRCRVHNEMTFKELLVETRRVAIEGYDNHLYPSVLAIQEITRSFDVSRTRLFSVMYGVQNNKNRIFDTLKLDGLKMSFVDGIKVAEDTNARFDLTYIIDFIGSEIEIRVNYNTDLFKRTTIERMLRQFLMLTEQAISDPGQKIARARLMASEEARRMVAAQSASDEVFRSDRSVVELFEAQAASAPDSVAVVQGGRACSYRMLNESANQWAAYLIDAGIGLEDKVGLLLEPGPRLVVAILAVLKAGAAFVPLNLDHPSERQEEVLTASGAALLLTDAPRGMAWRGRVIDMSSADMRDLRSGNPPRRAGPHNLAYVIFTSGTTGAPKGIEIELGGLLNTIEATQKEHAMRPEDGVLWTTPMSFDAAMLDVLWPLTAGGRVIVPDSGAVKDPAVLAAEIRSQRATVVQCVPIMLDALMDACEDGLGLPSLRLVICGGAFMSRGLCERFRARLGCTLANHYGPTEVTVDASTFDCSQDFVGEIVPIGKPISNTRIYILDEGLEPVPVGVKGDIYVSGPGVARGYMGDPRRTAAQFLPDPFRPGGVRMYRTGDVGSFLDTGDIYFSGRSDRQVKIRGNRVELEEIEARLGAHPAVASCAARAVGAHGAGDALVAYVELREGVNRLSNEHGDFRLFTLAQRPDLARAIDAVHIDAWPAYFAGDCTLKTYWPRLQSTFPDSQFALVDDRDQVVAAGNAVPIFWDGSLDGLPEGWDAGLSQGFEHAAQDRAPNTLMILTGVAASSAAGKGLSLLILTGFKMVAHALGLQRIVVPVRPTGKTQHPELTFEAWCARRREDGLPEDNWLRSHARAGGRVLKTALRSQRILATLRDWECWTGETFERSGEYLLKDTLQHVRVDVEQGVGEYYDPSVWIEHFYDAGDERSFVGVDAEDLRNFLKPQLPDYMIPEHFRFVPSMPLNAHGKIDERSLPSDIADFSSRAEPVAPVGPVEESLAAIWKDVLGLEIVGTNQDFFELGGHSLRAIQMLARVTSALHVTVRLRDFYLARTIRELAKRITDMNTGANSAT